ncbi:MAG: hypothetical protein ACK56I_25000, partial [bacterium]
FCAGLRVLAGHEPGMEAFDRFGRNRRIGQDRLGLREQRGIDLDRTDLEDVEELALPDAAGIDLDRPLEPVAPDREPGRKAGRWFNVPRQDRPDARQHRLVVAAALPFRVDPDRRRIAEMVLEPLVVHVERCRAVIDPGSVAIIEIEAQVFGRARGARSAG